MSSVVSTAPPPPFLPLSGADVCTVTLFVVVPPAPVHASVKVVAVLIGLLLNGVLPLPAGSRGPVQPSDDTHDVAALTVHERSTVPPTCTVVALAVSVT